jgi:hypothetical protein
MRPQIHLSVLLIIIQKIIANSTPELFQYCDVKNLELKGTPLADSSYITPGETLVYRVQSFINGFNLTYD